MLTMSPKKDKISEDLRKRDVDAFIRLEKFTKPSRPIKITPCGMGYGIKFLQADMPNNTRNVTAALKT